MPIRLAAVLSLLLLLAVTPTPTAQAAEAPAVVASIKPLHALVAGVMAGVGTPLLLVDGLRSEHDFALKPTDAAALQNARLVFWMGPSMEAFLARPIGSLAADVSVTFGDRLGPLILPSRLDLLHETHDGAAGDDHAEEPESEHHAAEEEAHDEHGHRHADPEGRPSPDLHAWLDPTIAAAMVDTIAAALRNADPDHATRYGENAAALKQRLLALDGELAETLAPVRHQPFIVFHDGYQYFERRYALGGIGSLSIEPHEPPGARHLKALRARIEAGRAVCVFAEPQFEPKVVRNLIEGTAAKAGTLDPIGSDQPAGAEAYFGLMRALAANLKACLSR